MAHYCLLLQDMNTQIQTGWNISLGLTYQMWYFDE